MARSLHAPNSKGNGVGIDPHRGRPDIVKALMAGGKSKDSIVAFDNKDEGKL